MHEPVRNPKSGENQYQGLVTKIVAEEIASSTGPTGGWLDSPKAVCAAIVAKIQAEVIARNAQPSPDDEELRLDGIMASTPSGALDVIAPTYGGISRSNWPARPVQPSPTSSFLCAARHSDTGANDPQDCDWPFCGCDQYADKVIEAIQESGFTLMKDEDLLQLTSKAEARQVPVNIPQGLNRDECFVCKATLLPSEEIPHCLDCIVTEEHEQGWDEELARQVPVGPEGKK